MSVEAALSSPAKCTHNHIDWEFYCSPRPACEDTSLCIHSLIGLLPGGRRWAEREIAEMPRRAVEHTPTFSQQLAQKVFTALETQGWLQKYTYFGILNRSRYQRQ